MRILLVTDAWHPQVNGVVRTLEQTTGGLRKLGHRVLCLTHQGKRTLPLPTYPEIRLALIRQSEVAAQIESFAPECIHIATEGTLGWAVRRYCLNRGLAFTTSFHSRFPEMLEKRLPLPGIGSLAHAWLRRFHAPARATLVPTPIVARRLSRLGFTGLAIWTRGVDMQMFRRSGESILSGLPRPIMLCAGRVAVEKNIGAFLKLEMPGTKVVVGDGPQLEYLRARYPEVVFIGYRQGAHLAATLASADVFVFPSRTDTFGLVMLEALACGVPVAAYPVEGPVDVITSPAAGALDDDLGVAITRALTVDPDGCVAFARRFSWDRVVNQFEAALVPVQGRSPNSKPLEPLTERLARTRAPVS